LNSENIFEGIFLWTKSMRCEPFFGTPVHRSTMDQRQCGGRGLARVGCKAAERRKSLLQGVLEGEGSLGVLTEGEIGQHSGVVGPTMRRNGGGEFLLTAALLGRGGAKLDAGMI
jgi:hypothetical protein